MKLLKIPFGRLLVQTVLWANHTDFLPCRVRSGRPEKEPQIEKWRIETSISFQAKMGGNGGGGGGGGSSSNSGGSRRRGMGQGSPRPWTFR